MLARQEGFEREIPTAEKAAVSPQLPLDVWEGEGGAPARPLRRSDESQRSQDDAVLLALGDEEDRILRHLGAAVIVRWNTFPAGLQRDLFEKASTSGEPCQVSALKWQIARFLHEHKDDAGQPRAIPSGAAATEQAPQRAGEHQDE